MAARAQGSAGKGRNVPATRRREWRAGSSLLQGMMAGCPEAVHAVDVFHIPEKFSAPGFSMRAFEKNCILDPVAMRQSRIRILHRC